MRSWVLVLDATLLPSKSWTSSKDKSGKRTIPLVGYPRWLDGKEGCPGTRVSQPRG
jgi:hypothetical protein